MFDIKKYAFYFLCLLIFVGCSDSDQLSTEGFEDNIEVTPSDLVMGFDYSSKKISVNATRSGWNFDVLSGNEWCHCFVNLDNTNEVIVQVDTNFEKQERVAEIKFRLGDQNCMLQVTQEKFGKREASIKYPQVESDIPLDSLTDEKYNIIPDFSHIGYMGSEKEIPDVPVVETITPPADGSDATALIQNAVDKISNLPLKNGYRGTLLLKRGIYNIKGSIEIHLSGIVLRGEGEDETGTVLVATGADKRTLIKISGSGNREPSAPPVLNVKDSYVPVGCFWLTVTNPADFSVGDDVVVYRPGTKNWIHDIKMDQIPPRADGGHVSQWNPASYNIASERKITHILGDTLHFDNPIMMALDRKYSKSGVYKYVFLGRIHSCGVENMLLKSEYTSETDEAHAVYGVQFDRIEHSWMRHVTSKYFVNGVVAMEAGSRFVTIKNCSSLEAKSIISGGRRYSFSINGAQQCLVIDCKATEGRHDCVTGSRGCGPNAFVRVNIRNAHADSGPHHRWNVGTLYDNIDSDESIVVQDRGPSGSGHGWAGANQVLWNCKARIIGVQNPWTSAKNYSIGSKGGKYKGAYPNRPDGVWVRQNETVTPLSLFDAQLDLRKQTNRLYH